MVAWTNQSVPSPDSAWDSRRGCRAWGSPASAPRPRSGPWAPTSAAPPPLCASGRARTSRWCRPGCRLRGRSQERGSQLVITSLQKQLITVTEKQQVKTLSYGGPEGQNNNNRRQGEQKNARFWLDGVWQKTTFLSLTLLFIESKMCFVSGFVWILAVLFLDVTFF